MQRIIGHQNVKERFQKSLALDRMPSTFLFIGPSGIGKRTFAIELARCLLCETYDEKELTSCGECDGCRLIDSQNHPDFEMVSRQKDKAFLAIGQFIGEKEKRNKEGLCFNISRSPFRGGRKIAIIDDADFFNQESANCLLKVLEEPPPRSVLIMIGTSEQKQLDTIRSRSQIVHFNPLSENEVLEVLQGQDTSSVSTAKEEMARNSNGSLNVIQQYLEEGLFQFRDQFLSKLATCELMSQGFPKEVCGFVEQAGKEPARRRDRIRLLADFAVEFYRQVAKNLVGIRDNKHSFPESLSAALNHWKSDAEAATDCIERCMDVHLQVAANANQTTLIESWLSDLGKISRGEVVYSEAKINLSY